MREIIKEVSHIFGEGLEHLSVTKLSPDYKLTTETFNDLPALILKEKTIIKKMGLSYEEGNVKLEIVLEDGTMIFVNELYGLSISYFSDMIEDIYENSHEIGVD